MTSVYIKAQRANRILVDLFVYGLVSVLALTCDCIVLFLLVSHGVQYIVASTLSFSAGMVTAYGLSVRFVFFDRRSASRGAEVLGFVAIGIAGLVLTQILLYTFVSRLGSAILPAKAVTVGLVFIFNFIGRRHFVFGKTARA